MDWSETDLRNTLSTKEDGCSFPPMTISRTISAIRKCTESTVYRESFGTKVSIVSSEEHEAADTHN